MPNGSDCSALLQTEALCVPTQWFLLDCTADGRAGPWLAADLANELDYLHLPGNRGAGDNPKDLVIASRPAALAALLGAHEQRRARGSKGRVVVWAVADLADAVGRRLLAELPLDMANALFWKSGVAPGVIRAGVGADRADRGRFLSLVRDQYFALPDFSVPYYGSHTRGQVYGNEFDSTLLCDADADLRALLGHLVPLHLEETRFARSHLQRGSGGGLLVIEEVMRISLRWRKIDWLAVAMYPYFKRLWHLPGGDDLLDVLDYTRCPRRENDPWAALQHRAREKDWNGIGYDLDPIQFDPTAGEGSYRVSTGDHGTRLHLAHFLRRQGAVDEALEQCELARAEGGYEADAGWLRVEGLARHERGESDAAMGLFRRYRENRLAGSDPPADALDDAGSVALMEQNFDLAYQLARRAVEKDRFLGHAYDTMVLAGREAGKPQYEREAAELAAVNGMVVPLHEREKTARVLREAKVSVVKPHERPPKKWWQFWR